MDIYSTLRALLTQGMKGTFRLTERPNCHLFVQLDRQMIPDTHSKIMGYLLWIFGFLGSHRFYYGKPWTGTLWFCTLGLLFVGWIIDLFLIPAMDREASVRFDEGPINYNIAWILLTFVGVLGLHRMYQGKWLTGLLYLLTGGLFFLGVLYDFWTLNQQIAERNRANFRPFQF